MCIYIYICIYSLDFIVYTWERVGSWYLVCRIISLSIYFGQVPRCLVWNHFKLNKLAGYFMNHSNDTNMGWSFSGRPACPPTSPSLLTPRQFSLGLGMRGMGLVLLLRVPFFRIQGSSEDLQFYAPPSLSVISANILMAKVAFYARFLRLEFYFYFF